MCIRDRLEDLAEAVAEGTRKQFMESVATVPLLIIGDLGMRKLPATTVCLLYTSRCV